MKKIFSKIWGLIKRHKILTVVCTLILVLLVIMFVVFVKFFVGGNDKYGDRLDGIEKVKITSREEEKIEDFVEENEEVSDVDVRVQGKIIYINIKVKSGTSLDKAKEIAGSTVEKIDEDKRSYYDLGYFLTSEDGEGFNVTGTKNAKLEHISWIKS